MEKLRTVIHVFVKDGILLFSLTHDYWKTLFFIANHPVSTIQNLPIRSMRQVLRVPLCNQGCPPKTLVLPMLLGRDMLQESCV